MDETAARDNLAAMVGMDDIPTISAVDFELLVTYAQIRDSAGVRPSDAGWVPTYDLNRAAARGWRWKAAKIASVYNVSGDGRSLSRAQWFDHCLEMVKLYSSSSLGTVVVGAQGVPGYTDVIGNLNVG